MWLKMSTEKRKLLAKEGLVENWIIRFSLIFFFLLNQLFISFVLSVLYTGIVFQKCVLFRTNVVLAWLASKIKPTCGRSN